MRYAGLNDTAHWTGTDTDSLLDKFHTVFNNITAGQVWGTVERGRF